MEYFLAIAAIGQIGILARIFFMLGGLEKSVTALEKDLRKVEKEQSAMILRLFNLEKVVT